MVSSKKHHSKYTVDTGHVVSFDQHFAQILKEIFPNPPKGLIVGAGVKKGGTSFLSETLMYNTNRFKFQNETRNFQTFRTIFPI